MGLKDLPVKPDGMGASDTVVTAYLEELGAVATPEQLWEFAKRWRPLYLMTPKPRIDKKAKNARRFRVTQNNMQSLLDGTWDPKTALQCLTISRTGNCAHATQFSCVGMHIAVPLILIHADFISEKFGVPKDMALIQLCGGLEALEG